MRRESPATAASDGTCNQWRGSGPDTRAWVLAAARLPPPGQARRVRSYLYQPSGRSGFIQQCTARPSAAMGAPGIAAREIAGAAAAGSRESVLRRAAERAATAVPGCAAAAAQYAAALVRARGR